MSVDRVDSRHRRVRRPTPVAAAPVSAARGSRRALVTQTVAGRQRASAAPVVDTRHVEALIARHMQAQEEAASAAIRVKDTFQELEKAMVESGIKNCRAGDWVAEYVSTKGRSTNTIDPAGFYKLCKNKEDFFAAVSVNATEAKRILPTKELATVTTTTSGKDGAPTLRVGKVKVN